MHELDLARLLDGASRIPKAVAQLNLETVADGYKVQEAVIARRLSRGEKLIGLKMGLTSKAKMEQVGVHEVIMGRLTDAMQVPDGGTVSHGQFIHPRIEPEVAFLIRNRAIAAVAPALELIDSRYKDFKFTAPDVIADNTSAASFVIGRWQPVPDGLDNLGVLLEVDGKVVQSGSTAAILGDPRRAFAAGLRLAGQVSDGWVFLAGAATAAVPITPGMHVRAIVEQLGTASVGVAE